MDGRTDGQTDEPSYRNARTHLKKIETLAWEHDAVKDADAIRRGEGGGDRQDGKNATRSGTVWHP